MIAGLLLLQLQAGTPVTITGRAVRIEGADSLPAVGAMMVLHRVGEANQGPIDSMRSGARGVFRFTATRDTGATLLVSGRWHGVEYFAPPLDGPTVVVVVTDTSTTTPVSVAARHVVIGGPAADGARDVVDLVVLRNAANRTRVGSDSLTPAWSMLVPPLVANLQVGEADFARESFDLHGDTLLLHGPIPPGDRQFFLQYQLAPGARSLELVLRPPVDTLSILAEESDLDIGGGLTRQGTESMAGREFARWSGGGGRDVTIAFRDARGLPGWILPALIAAFVLPIFWATRRMLARHR